MLLSRFFIHPCRMRLMGRPIPMRNLFAGVAPGCFSAWTDNFIPRPIMGWIHPTLFLFLCFLFRHRIVTIFSKRVTSQYTPNCETGSLDDAEPLDCLDGIGGTGRRKAAYRRRFRRNGTLIEPYQRNQHFFHPVIFSWFQTSYPLQCGKLLKKESRPTLLAGLP